ncbi:hypothetical protein J6TS1_21380 [Siminovitchia terrae]|uniref:Uncharacterized protein n=1 Tax=Siminovitchia terrae TaxID=1914933 RepID=A0A429X150_SIMTE|nr:hypothetical protein [Siminovitchia terrae]RST57186.1 hypothetical protein D5F11_024080 [Siminovitchia terrae]GIN96268.1 hypothetical protein J6TS1_21380 [Siminovitchia terrae]
MRKFWSTMLAAAGISAAAYGLSKYRNGKYMEPVKKVLNNAKDMLQNAGGAANNPLMEISKELAPTDLINNERKKTKQTSH